MWRTAADTHATANNRTKGGQRGTAKSLDLKHSRSRGVDLKLQPVTSPLKKV